MNIPKKIHYFWTGNNISQKDLKNIMAVRAENPGFKLNIWGNKKDEPLIINTFNSLTFSDNNNNPYHFGLTQIKFDFTHRVVETAFDFLFQTIIQKPSTSPLSHPPDKKNQAQEDIIGGNRELVRYLRHIYYFNLQGPGRNYAISSDIARLVILYMEGGLYLDVDVELSSSHIKKISLDTTSSRFDAIKLNSDLGFGDVTGHNWGSERPQNRFGNAILASQPQSDSILQLLLHMAREIKRSHLSLQISESPYGNEIRRGAQSFQVDKIEHALMYEKTERKKVILDRNCSTLAPVWRTGINPNPRQGQDHIDNSEQMRRNRRLKLTTGQTGPRFYSKHFGFEGSVPPPDERKIQIEGDDTRMFRPVNAEAAWANLQKRDKKK